MRKKLTTEQFIEKAKLVHGNNYLYDNAFYVNAKTKLSLVCPTHGHFNQTPNDHLSGRGCPDCGNINRPNKKRHTRSYFIKNANEVHDDKYTYGNAVYVNSNDNILITCPIHGDFKQRAAHHINGSGCPDCANNRHGNIDNFINKANEMHGNKYTYGNAFYVNAITKLLITCAIHGEFYQWPGVHLSGRGCPICKSSKGHIAVEKILKKLKLSFNREVTCKTLGWSPHRYRFDIALKYWNVVIEYNGKQHYNKDAYHNTHKGSSLKKQQLTDKRKRSLANRKGFIFIAIHHKHHDNGTLEEYLTERLRERGVI